ncbi:MAG TPA: M48 family metallopeptidase [Allosphingosinicella sp.]
MKALLLPLAAAAAAAFVAPRTAPAQPAPPVAPTAAVGSFLRAEDHRIVAIVHRLGVAGREHCPATLPLTGLAFHHLAEYRPRDRPEAIARYGLDRGIGLLSVVEGSPAAQALLQAGDVLVSVNGVAFPAPQAIAAEEQENERRRQMSASEEMLEEALRLGAAEVRVARGGQIRTVRLASVPGCPARGRLARSGQDNAFADGRYVIMTTGFLGFFRSDDELAVALAHELAHNILRHPQQLEAQGVPRGMMRHIGRNARLVRATEVEADQLSVRLLASAGYDLDAILPFWRRLHGRADSALQIISAHPGLKARERYIGAAIAEVRAGAVPAPAR